MKLAILSDIHDHVWNLTTALKHIAASGTGTLICCGDLCSPFVVALLKNGFAGRIHLVFGNNDADLYRITRQAQHGRLELHGEFAELVIAGEQLLTHAEFLTQNPGLSYFGASDVTRIAVNHFDSIARPLAAAGTYDLVFYGHNHKHRHERLGAVDVINPGAIMGYDGPGERDIPATFVVYDTDAKEPTWYEVAMEVEGSAIRRSVRDYSVSVEPLSL